MSADTVADGRSDEYSSEDMVAATESERTELGGGVEVDNTALVHRHGGERQCTFCLLVFASPRLAGGLYALVV